MASDLQEDFESWLSFKLKSLNTDEGVMGNYIAGILNGEETIDEKTEALQEILSEITQNEISTHCNEILDHWRMSREPGDGAAEEESPEGTSDDVEEKLVKLLESNTKTKAVTRQCTDEEKKIRQAILAQYSQTSDPEFDSDGDSKTKVKVEDEGLMKNMNATSVAQAEKEKREKAKQESQKKKDKDKEDREKQKQQAQEKKEKRKTQKGERKR